MARKISLATVIPASGALFGIAMLVGCEERTTIEGGSGDGIHVNAPGVKVDVGGGRGVQVETPHTKVDVGGGKGVQIETPKTDVHSDGNKEK